MDEQNRCEVCGGKTPHGALVCIECWGEHLDGFNLRSPDGRRRYPVTARDLPPGFEDVDPEQPEDGAITISGTPNRTAQDLLEEPLEAFELRRRNRVAIKRLSETLGQEGNRARRFLSLLNANIAADSGSSGQQLMDTLAGQMALFDPSSTLDEESS